MSFRSKQSCWILTISLAAVAIAYLWLIWLPGRRQIQEIQAQLAQKRNFVMQATNLPLEINAVEQNSAKAKAFVEKWEQNAPKKRNLSELFGKINALAKEANLSIIRFDPQPAVVHEKIKEIPIAISCNGSFGNIYEFLGNLEQLPVSIWVDSMRLDKMIPDSKDVRCELSLVVFSK